MRANLTSRRLILQVDDCGFSGIFRKVWFKGDIFGLNGFFWSERRFCTSVFEEIFQVNNYFCKSFNNFAMDREDKYGVISVAYRSRLLFRTDAEYRQAIGVSFETVANNRDSAREMEMYYGILHREAGMVVFEGELDDIIAAYLEASEFYLSLDWGDRSQLASRRRFCRMIFRLYASGGRELTNDEIFKFKIKGDDERLLKRFFPEGCGGEPAVDIEFVMLFAFGLLRPFTDNSRGRDIGDRETIEMLERMQGLVEVLKDDMPRLGLTDKPIVFDEVLAATAERVKDHEGLEECTPLAMYSGLRDITRLCRTLVTAENLRKEDEQLCVLNMYGIWVDDADGGENRFWIFPDNTLLSFCYEFDGMTSWLRPYEFRVKFAKKTDFMDMFIIVSPEGNLAFNLTPERAIGHEHIACGSVDMEWSEESGELSRLTFHEGEIGTSGWFNWRTLERLNHDDPRYEKFHNLLWGLYDPKSPRSMFLKVVAPELIDCHNNLVGRDNKYLYVYDWQPRRCVVKEREEDLFFYEVAPEIEHPGESLLDIKVSEKHPLYAIPLDHERKNFKGVLARLKDILSDAENIRNVFVVHSAQTGCPRLCFPNYSTTVALDEDLIRELGVLKFTTNPFSLERGS